MIYKEILDNSWQYYSAIVSYQGTYYNGWQSQPNKKGIQDIIESVLYKIFSYKQKIHGASRTDAGVHSFGQVFTFHAPSIINIEKLKLLLNNSLPDDIYIRSIVEVNKDFHPRFAAKKKVYQYLISKNKTIPSINFFIHYEEKPFDKNLFQEALSIFIGTHDFRSFAKEKKEKNTIKTIYHIQCDEYLDILIITIVGNGFLRYMIRRLIGAALYVSQKKDILYLKNVFKQENSSNHLRVMPAKGLMLKNVIYDNNEEIDYQNSFLMPFLKKMLHIY